MMDGDMGFYEYLQIIRKRRLIIAVVFIAIIIANSFYLKSKPVVYQAVAKVQVSQRQTLGGLLTELVTVTPGDPMSSQAMVAKSFPVIERAARKLGIIRNNAAGEEITSLVTDIQAGLATEVEKNTNVILISFTDRDPKKTALIVNAVADSYIEENLLEKNKEARRVKEFIQGQLKELKLKLETSEEALRRFKESGEITGIAIPLQNKLADLEGEKAKLLRLYTERHPAVVRLSEEEAMLRERLKSIPQQEFQYARLSRDLEINEKLYKNLQEKFEEARISEIEKASDVTLLDPATVPTTPTMKNQMGSLLGIIAALIISLTAGLLIEQFDTSIGTIEGIESYLKLSVLGVIPYLPIESEKEKAGRGKGAKSDKIVQMQSQLLLYYSMTSPITEAYKILRTNIQMEVFKGNAQNKIIMISSSGPEEGKSITCANLAIAMAQTGSRVLIIDADLRRTSIYRLFGFNKTDYGLTEVLRNTVTADSAIKTYSDLLMSRLGLDRTLAYPGIDNLNILLAGSVPHLASELLGTKEVDSLLLNLRSKYDLILIDTPPVLAVADAVILARRVDAVILVYKVGKTARNAIMRAKIQLEAVNAPCKGIVLNNISREVEIRSAYYYHYKYYGEKKEPGKERKGRI